MQINVLEYLLHTAARLPDQIAYADEARSVTFSALLARAKALGARVHALAGGINRPAAVLARRNVETLEAMFGALWGGCFYVPLDAAMPAERMLGILEGLKPGVLLCAPEDLELARSLAGDVPVLCTDADGGQTDPEAWRAVLDADPAYVIYTSGSTGAPKGILISHRSVIDFTDWYADFTGVAEDDRLGNQAPFFFDLSVKDVYLTLKTGASCYLLPKKCFSFTVLLVRALDEHRITTLSWATAAFHMAASFSVLTKHPPHYLKRVLLGGEALQAKQLNVWRSALPQVRYVNLYGPTETTVDCTYYPIDRDFADDEPIPIGRACPNMEVLVLNEQDRPAAVGEPGEICARGTGVAIGYYGDPEKTAACFVQNPLNPNYPDRIYRTGDIGCWGEDGNLYFLCRKDSQVKHNGYRIELGEIETALNAVPAVEAAVCLYDAKADKLVAVYAGAPDTAQLLEQLKTRLPKYMTPERFCRVEALPRLPNGKTDRVSLKQQYLS